MGILPTLYDAEIDDGGVSLAARYDLIRFIGKGSENLTQYPEE